MAKILLVEDEKDNRDLIRLTLEMAGHDVAEATTGEEAVAHARREAPALILMDISLAGPFDGLEATRRLRCETSLSRIPIVALTAHAMRGDRERALAAGCDEHLTKPITDLQVFLETVDRIISDNES